MAGRGQHFIPKHFQKPFVFSTDKDQLLMYRRGSNNPIQVARGDSGKEHDFYSSPSLDGDVTLDDLITNYEQKIFPLVDDIRELPVGALVNADIAAEIVVHFAIRSQHLRKSISELWNGLAKTMYALATDPKSVIETRRLPAHRAPFELALAINEQVISHRLDSISGVNSQTLGRIIYMLLREQIDQLAAQAGEAISLVVSEFGEQANDRIRDAHRGILLSAMAPPKRVEELRELRWKIVEHIGSAAILPDCVCIAANTDGEWQPLLFSDKTTSIVMPLTPHTLLVGSSSEDQTFDVTQFNLLAANSSFDFFLSKEEISWRSDLVGDIGQSLRAQIDNMVSSNVRTAIDSYFTASISDQSSQLNKLRVEPEIQEQYTYEVYLHDFGDGDYAQKVANALAEILEAANLNYLHSMLDGFSFANDYEAAINLLDRGYEVTREIKSENSPLGMGVAIPITVLRDGKFKTRFILREFLAHAILSESDADRTPATSTIRYLLSGLFLDEIERTRFAGWMSEKINTPIDNYLYASARKIFDVYYRARMSAFSLDEASGFISALQSNLPEIISAIIDRRRRYRVDGDLDGFLKFAFDSVELILTHLARVSGIFAAVDSLNLKSSEISTLLLKYGMVDWLNLFIIDLSNFHEKIEDWKDFEEIFFVNRHFERWLLMFGIIIQDGDDGEFYAHVPLGFDAEYLSQLVTDLGPTKHG